jgi:hypothetical protein
MGFYHTAAILKNLLSSSPWTRFEESSIKAKGGRTIDFNSMGLKMAARDKILLSTLEIFIPLEQ